MANSVDPDQTAPIGASMANSVDPDQTSPIDAVCSGSTHFQMHFLLGALRVSDAFLAWRFKS